MEDKVYIVTVSQVNKYIKQMMDKVPVLANLWVKGEISNFKQHYSGHIYMTLKDEGGVLKSVMFKGSASRLAFMPGNGMKVLARGRVSVYERDGAYQLYIEEMQPDGVGALHIALEQLKERLSKEGLFDEHHKKALPRYPETIGIITATTGAAIRDMIHVLARRYPCAKLLIYPSLVQGEGAAAQIAGGIEYFNKNKNADVLIVGRGGGSIEDLWAFNEEVTARAIFASEIPVISAVGHETDFTVADLVADLRAPTPSAAAELVAPSVYEIHEKFSVLKSRIVYCMGNKIKSFRQSLTRLPIRSPKGQIDDERLRLDSMTRQLVRNLSLIRSGKADRLGALCGKLEAMSPLAVLKRGYGMARDSEGRVINSVMQLGSGDAFELVLSDGSKNCRVL